MKTSVVLISALLAVASAKQVAKFGAKMIGLKKRDPEFEHAMLVIRDRTVSQWTKAIDDPSTISPEMIKALADRGYFPPASAKGTVSRRAVPETDPIGAMTKEYALKSVQEGAQIPQPIVERMKQDGWTGPGLSRRSFMDEDGYESFDARDLYEDDFQSFDARDIHEEYLDLYDY